MVVQGARSQGIHSLRAKRHRAKFHLARLHLAKVLPNKVQQDRFQLLRWPHSLVVPMLSAFLPLLPVLIPASVLQLKPPAAHLPLSVERTISFRTKPPDEVRSAGQQRGSRYPQGPPPAAAIRWWRASACWPASPLAC